MASKDTGFHPHDADWTRGRALAVGEADNIARKDMWQTRGVTLALIDKKENQK